MKKLIIGIIVVGTILGGVLGFMGGSFLPANDDIDSSDVSNTEEDTLDTFSVLDDLETVDEDDIEIVDIDEEEQADEEVDQEPEEEADTRRLIPRRNPVSVYDGAFIKFSYDGSLTVSDETLTSFMLTNAGEENVITVDIYTNEENKSPYDFVSQSDNVINYYEEAEKNDIVPEEIYLDDKLHAVKFEKFPGIAEQDIYLVIVDGYLVQVSVRDMFEEVFQTTVLTIEKA